MAEQLTICPRPWPRQFLADFERTGEALLFYLFLLTRMDPATGYFRGAFEAVAAEIGVSVVEVRKWLEQLEREGYLEDGSLDGMMIVSSQL